MHQKIIFLFLDSFPPGNNNAIKEELEIDYYGAQKEVGYYNPNGNILYSKIFMFDHRFCRDYISFIKCYFNFKICAIIDLFFYKLLETLFKFREDIHP